MACSSSNTDTVDYSQDRLDYLINQLHVYDGFDHKGQGLKHAVKNKIRGFANKQRDMTVVEVDTLYEDLWAAAKGTGYKGAMAAALQRGSSDFRIIPSDGHHVKIVDRRGKLLAYRFGVPEPLRQNLSDTEQLIPDDKKQRHERGTTVNRHWGMWKKYMKEPRMTGEYVRDLPHSKQWAEANAELFRYLSDVLRILEPKMYKRFVSIREFLPRDVTPMCGAWYACAINQNMTEDGRPHIDSSDYYCGLNVVTGWGEFTSAKIVLWQLDVKVELKSGDAMLFLGRLIGHNAVDIEGGPRNIVDGFVHRDPLAWKDKMHKQLTGYGRKGKEAADAVGKMPEVRMTEQEEMAAMYSTEDREGRLRNEEWEMYSTEDGEGRLRNEEWENEERISKELQW